MTSTLSANGNTTSVAYDHLGRASGSTLPTVLLYTGSNGTPTSAVSYDGDGNVVSTTDGAGDVSTASYDPLGRMTSSANALGETTILTYTATEPSAIRDPLGNVTTYSTYDAAGRLGQVSDAAGEVQQYGYDNNGNVLTIVSGNGSTSIRTETRTYDPLNELATDSIAGPSTPSQTTTLSYDLDGNLVRADHANGDVTFTIYNLADDAIAGEQDPGNVNLPVGGTHNQQTFAYDLAANQTNGTDWDTRQSQVTLDGDTRVTAGTNSFAGTTISSSATYDPNGNVLSQQQIAGGTTHNAAYAYNAVDWQTSTTDDGMLSTFGFDGAARQRTVTIGAGSGSLATTLNGVGRATGIAEGTNSASLSYNALDMPMQVSLPGSVTQHTHYDSASRPTYVDASGPTVVATPLANSYGYGYDATSQTTSITSTVSGASTNNLTLTHDALGHLTGATGTGTTGSWAYGNFDDNLTSASSTGSPTTTYTYSSTTNPNELNFTVTSAITTYYGLDSSGHTTSISLHRPPTCPHDTSGTCLSYDAAGRLSTVTITNTTTITMTYNAFGQRSTYTATGPGTNVSEHFQYRGSELAQMVMTGTSAYTNTYLYRQDGSPLELLQLKAGVTSRYWYEVDGRGNVVALTDGTGNVVDRYSYDLWGVPTIITNTVPQNLLYAGYWYDNELKWYWLSVRSYDPKLERFLQPDPSQQEGLFSYAYVGDDPVDFTDPSGLDACGTISSFFSFGGGFINSVCTSAVAFGRSVVQGLGSLLGGTYTLVAGSDISALTNPNASGGEKFVAIVDLASNALLLVPGVDAVDAARLAFKGATKLEEHELTYDEAKALVKRVVGCGCFPGNTGVQTSRGLAPIASLKVGDLVLAEDPSTHKVEPEPVLAVIDDGIKPLMQVRMSDGSSLSVTTNHPFFVDSGPGITTPQWVQAGDLRVDDQLRTEDGQDVTITALRYDTGYAHVYTLSVAHDHTFFVGSGEPVLVHNSSCPIVSESQLPPDERAGIANALQEIASGTRPPGKLGRNFGVEFKNYANQLPSEPPGYYHEYTVLPPGATQRGLLRLVIGAKNEVYYSWTHYGDTGDPAFVRLIP